MAGVGFLGMAQLGHLGGSFWRVLHTDFHSGRTRLQFYQQWLTVPFSPSLCQHLLLVILPVCVILHGIR